MMKHFTSNHLDLAESLAGSLDMSEKYAYYQGIIRYARLSNVSENNLDAFCHQLKKDTSVCIDLLRNDPK